MNRLSPERRAQVIRALVDGASIRATCRMTGTAKGTVLRLLAEIGEVCATIHDENVRDVHARQVQCDEVWSFVAKKEKHVPYSEKGRGDGPAGKYLGTTLPDFTSAEMNKQSDGELFWKISTGKAPMPTFEEILSDEQRWFVVSYLRTFCVEEYSSNK